ncbi:MAG TPA: PQQ-binding-like beta-propeller repeat protein [Gemmataceae bacterium]|nr:PQQ-binding-like beta-propeller repeat protein [Gemmataceae bacterium]
MNRTAWLIVSCALLTLACAGNAADWPQWRGPNRDDVSQESGLLKEWPKEGPKLLWTCEEAGIGFSGPAIVGDRLYSMGSDDKKEYIFAIDVKNGKKLWSTEVGELFTNMFGDGPRGTPTVDGDLVYALGSNGDLICVKAASGEKVWSVSLKKDFEGQVGHGWGFCESVLIDQDKLICTPGGKKGALLALDKKTGKEIWRTKDLEDPASSASIITTTVAGKRHYVQMTQKGVVGVSPEDGRVLWHFPREGRTAAIPTPIAKDHFVYVVSGYGAGSQLLDLAVAGDKFEPKSLYDKDKHKNMDNKHGGVVRVGDYLYGFCDGKGWVCQKFDSGDIVWPDSERHKLGHGSLTYADGHLYCYHDKGTIAVIEASPDGWKESGRFDLPKKSSYKRKGSAIWTHPVVANGKLYLRDQDLIFCFDIKAP